MLFRFTDFHERTILWVLFKDKSCGMLSYPGGRFLVVDATDEEGNVVLDFNKAHNPPCAYTNFATCPLPPADNVIEASISAGEMEFIK